MKAGKLTAALIVLFLFSCFSGAAGVYGDAANGHFDRGNYYYSNGRPRDAIAEFRQTASLRPGSSEAYTNIGLCYNQLTEYNNSSTYFNKALQINPNDHIAYTGLGVACHHLKRYQDAVDACKKAISISPGYALAYFNCALAYGRLGNFTEARKYYERARDLYGKQGNEAKAKEAEDSLKAIDMIEDYYDYY